MEQGDAQLNIILDTRGIPVVRLKFVGKQSTLALDRYLEWMDERALKFDQSFALLLDINEMQRPTPEYQKAARQREKKAKHVVEKKLIGVAHNTSSFWARSTIAAYNMISRTSYKNVVKKSDSAAYEVAQNWTQKCSVHPDFPREVVHIFSDGTLESSSE